MSSNSALEIRSIRKTIKKKLLLDDVSLCVAEGETFGFLGPNGAGKTTTMKCVLGLIRPDSGSIEVLGRPLSHRTKYEIGFMPEQTYFYKYLTGREFLRFNADFYGMKKSFRDERIEELLDRVALSRHGDGTLSGYSKGMLQRIGLAQAIIHQPRIVFLDEPMSGLDPIGRKMVKDIILDLKREGVTVFFNTHILSDVESLCDRFAIIHE
ncbi:MAG TPA: ABC transporter ATP-binding protein [bacterium]|nr:ABC transporter ATP-binding protein [bacterium]